MIFRDGSADGLCRIGICRFPAMWMAMLVAVALAGLLPFKIYGQEPRPAGKADAAEYGVGNWIWASETHDQQLCRFWREFEIPRSSIVVNARLRITADNSYRLFLDGQELGRGGEWRNLTEYDLTLLLEPGAHTVAVEAFNDFELAGLLAGLHVELANGRTIDIISDPSWKVVPNQADDWKTRTQAAADWMPATVVLPFGVAPRKAPSKILKAPAIRPADVKFWQTGWFQITLLSSCVGVALICVWLISKLAVHSQAEAILKRERARIARDIHDDVTAGLTQLVLLGEVAQSESPAGSELRQQMGQVCEKARNLARSMNEVIWAVNSQRDTSRSFITYVCKYTETFLQPTTIRCRFDLEEEMPDIPCNLGVRRNLFLAMKEALHNVVRHSNATEALVQVRSRGAEIFLAVEDNGRGFDPVLADEARNGLSNMIKRASEAGGSCVIISHPGAGCRVEFTAPLDGRLPRRAAWLGWPRKRTATASPKQWPVGKPPEQW